MTQRKLYIEETLYLSLETLAEIYSVEVTWMRRVYDRGLLGHGVDSESSICIPAVRLDLVATVVRLHGRLGLDERQVSVAIEQTHLRRHLSEQ